MRRNVLLIVGAILLSASSGVVAAGVDLAGAVPGKWTMDFGAARKLAARKKFPVLLNFSGSDWCGWCKVMEKNVFSQKDWKIYAKDNLLMVVIDFPKDGTIVPKKYLERNAQLKEKYNVEGFPTFIVLDDDAETVLGRMGAGQEKTPESVIEELSVLLRYRTAEIAKYSSNLKPQAKSAYLDIVNQITESTEAIKGHKQKISVAKLKLEELTMKVVNLKASAQEFRATQLGGDEVRKYKKAKTKLDKVRKQLEDWLGTNPDRSDENMKKYQEMSTSIQELTAKLSKY